MNRTTINISEQAAKKVDRIQEDSLLGKRSFAKFARIQMISTLSRGQKVSKMDVITTFGESNSTSNLLSENTISSEPSSFYTEPALQKKVQKTGVCSVKTLNNTYKVNQQREFYKQYKAMLSEAKSFNQYLLSSNNENQTVQQQQFHEFTTKSEWSSSNQCFNHENQSTSPKITVCKKTNNTNALAMNSQVKCDEKKRLFIAESMTRCIPFDNYINQFIFHKKYKDFETEEQKYQGVSRFHNLNRMFMHNIIKILSRENLEQFEIPFAILNKISSMVHDIKTEAFKKYNNGKSKTCFFNHYHYNLLFLRITPYTLKIFSASHKDLELHQNIIGVKFDKESLNSASMQQDIEYANLLKAYIFAIVESTINCNIRAGNYENCVRLQYVYRVLQGIQKLSEGSPIKRF